ncbi:MAG TPA: hypothetical protein VN616_03900 [Puia sp.]|nr:hypothetical protein [Puia sp.]
MRILLITAILCGRCIGGYAQQVVDVDAQDFNGTNHQTVENAVNGLMLQPYKYVRVTDGTPYFNKEYMKARLFDGAGTSYASNAVRLNLLDNEVDFKDAAGNELVATTPVKQIQLTDTTTGTKYLFVKGDQIPEAGADESNTWLQVLVNDKVSLLRKTRKSIRETIPYGTSTTEEQIVSLDSYFVRMNKTFTHVKNWQEILQLFSDKKEAVESFARSHHLKGKSESDYTQLVRYYNSLPTP